MLQQTQANRVVPYFERFLQRFPTIKALASAKNVEILTVWQGLGYNRRALYLQAAARQIVEEFQGTVPTDVENLSKLPGIGVNTAGAILAYAFNRPTVFIETNIRKVIIHHFFAGQEKVSDKEIAAIVERELDRENPREWYWAMMDYGTWLGATKTVRNNRSQHYNKQSQFVGSKRFTRSQLLKYLLRSPHSKSDVLTRFASLPHAEQALNELINEGFCVERDNLVNIRD